MEIPSYEDYDKLKEEIRGLKYWLNELINYLNVPKIYKVGGKEYTNVDEAYIEVNKVRQEYFNKHAGMTCMSEPQWITERPDFSRQNNDNS